ncbi:MAG: 2-iminoacetate synthase ThiH [Candidatus Omnitrophota bacterium]
MSDAVKDLEALALQSQKITRQYFGRTISLYAPLYISNYCDNCCVYCGFNHRLPITRTCLTFEEIENECRVISQTGIQNILLLTGESRLYSPVDYIREAVLVARKYFPNIALEVYPMETDEYCQLYRAGVDGVTVYQETYNREQYQLLHPAGKKRNYDYRVQTPERIAEAGIRHISLGVLLGLVPWPEDVDALASHLSSLEKKYPGVEWAVSFPRLQKIPGASHSYFPVSDREMLRIISTFRIRFPRIGINLSTRESAQFRDTIFPFGITRMSAGSVTAVGGYTHEDTRHDNTQFAVNDERSLSEMKQAIIVKGYDPVLTDWRNFGNE